MGGSAEVDGDNIGCWELSSARTTFAGVPLGIQNVKDVLRPWISATSDCFVEASCRSKFSGSVCEDRALMATLTSSQWLPGQTSKIRANVYRTCSRQRKYVLSIDLVNLYSVVVVVAALRPRGQLEGM